MRRLTISVDEALADTFDQLVSAKGYQNRSEAFRDLLRDELDKKSLQGRRREVLRGSVMSMLNR
jgi:CopG family transcriptional regulator, nickel-responsive regulator